jgi:hypothetical protein
MRWREKVIYKKIISYHSDRKRLSEMLKVAIYDGFLSRHRQSSLTDTTFPRRIEGPSWIGGNMW